MFQKREKIRDLFRFYIVGDAIKEVVITCTYIILKVFHGHWRRLDTRFIANFQLRFEFGRLSVAAWTLDDLNWSKFE